MIKNNLKYWIRLTKHRKFQQRYRQTHKEEGKLYQKKYREENKEKIRIYNKNRNKEKIKVRTKTYKKYGNLPQGMQYHHTTNPYHIDKWIILTIEEHCKIHRIY